MEKCVKILVIGNSGVGKTSLCNRYSFDEFHHVKPTVGVEFYSKKYNTFDENKKAVLSFWDIGGQERFIGMTHVYYKEANCCLLMFDLTNRESFLSCEKWKQDLDSKYELPDGSKCPCLLIGNKCDLYTRAVTQREIDEFCAKYDFIGYTELSVKRNIMVHETMGYIAEEATKHKEKYASCFEQAKEKAVTLSLKDKLENKFEEKCSVFSFFTKKGCC